MSSKEQNSLDNLAKSVMVLYAEKEVIRAEVGNVEADLLQEVIELVQKDMEKKSISLRAKQLLEGM